MRRISVVLSVTLLFLALPLWSEPRPEGASWNPPAALLAEAKAAAARKAVGGWLTLDGRTEPILAFSVGVTNVEDSSSGGARTGKTTLEDIVMIKEVDFSAPKLLQACADGVHFPGATLVVADSKGQPYLTITMKDVRISSYQTSGSAGDAPTESLSLNYGEIEYILIGL